MMTTMREKGGVMKRDVVEAYREDLIGIPVMLMNAVIREIDEETGEEFYTVPDMEGLLAAIAVTRCLVPLKLSGADVKFLRKALDMTARELAEELQVKPETLSRWENDGQTMAGYSEKVLRQYVCALLHKEAPAIDYDPGDIARMRIKPVRAADDLPILYFERVKLKSAELRTKESRWDIVEPLAA